MRVFHRAHLTAVLAALVVVSTGAAQAASTRSAPATDPSAPTLAILHLRVSTTSEWTNVRIRPAGFAVWKVTSSTPGVHANPILTNDGRLALGLAMRRASGGGVADLIGVFVEPTGASQITVNIKKGDNGQTSAELWNRSNGADVPIGVVHDDISRGKDNNHTSGVFDRSTVFRGINAPLPRADSRRLVLADYYPWFSSGSYNDYRMSDRPAQRYDSRDPAGIDAMVALARANGIDGFAMSWRGGGGTNDVLQPLLDASARHSSVATIYLETQAATLYPGDNRPSPAIVEQWLAQALSHASSPAFLKLLGVPVVFAFEMTELSSSDWVTIEQNLARAGTPVQIVGDGGWDRIQGAALGWHQYNPNTSTPSELRTQYLDLVAKIRGAAALDATQRPGLMVSTVSPGFNDMKSRGGSHPTVSRGSNGSRYASVWQSAMAADPDYVLITSWNEWYEGTAVQPSENYGDMALRQTAQFATQFTGRAATSGP